MKVSVYGPGGAVDVPLQRHCSGNTLECCLTPGLPLRLLYFGLGTGIPCLASLRLG